MKDNDYWSMPSPQCLTFCIFMQLFIEDLSFEKSSIIVLFYLSEAVKYKIAIGYSDSRT